MAFLRHNSNKALSNNNQGEISKATIKSWYQETYETAIIQRNLFIVLSIIAIITTLAATLVVRYIKNTKSIEPFVIEIERKTGIPTVVDPISIKDYSANEAVQRYFIMKYIKAREEYFYQTFQYNFDTVVRVLSSPSIYYSDYKPKFAPSNPNSPYNLYGQSTNRTVKWKSIIFQSEKVAQVRLTLENQGGIVSQIDKLVLIAFDFQNIEMNDNERLVNPLGFIVTMYKIEDENRS